MKFESYCKSGNETILFIHSLFASAWEWAPTILHVTNIASFHIITPNLEPADFLDLNRCASNLAQHIKMEAKGGKAHIVGLSIGAQIAVHLTNSFPEVVNSLFLSGYNTFSPLLRPLGSLFIYNARKTQSRSTGVSSFTLRESHEMFRIVSSSPQIKKAPVRTVIITGVLEDSRNSPLILEKAMSGGERVERVNLDMGHLWNRDNGKDFGNELVNWIKRV